MTNGKSKFEVGVAFCAPKWKTPDIFKHKTAGRLYAEMKQQDCGSPPPSGEFWIGLNPPMPSTDNKVTGATTNMLRKENKQKHHSC